MRLERLIRLLTQAVLTSSTSCGLNWFVTNLDSTFDSVNDPPMNLATIRNEIEKLEPAEKASLIDLLWDSLDDDSVRRAFRTKGRRTLLRAERERTRWHLS
jgi:hypothetical protein